MSPVEEESHYGEGWGQSDVYSLRFLFHLISLFWPNRLFVTQYYTLFNSQE